MNSPNYGEAYKNGQLTVWSLHAAGNGNHNQAFVLNALHRNGRHDHWLAGGANNIGNPVDLPEDGILADSDNFLGPVFNPYNQGTAGTIRKRHNGAEPLPAFFGKLFLEFDCVGFSRFDQLQNRGHGVFPDSLVANVINIESSVQAIF